jgi:hypothetical protein
MRLSRGGCIRVQARTDTNEEMEIIMKTLDRFLVGAAIAAGILATSTPALAFGNLPPQCTEALILHVACTNMTADGSYVWSGNITTASKTIPWQGNTTATINAQYPAVIIWEFENESSAVLNAQMAQITPLGLARFSHHFYMASGGNISTLMQLAAQKLSAANLVRWYTAFGRVTTDYNVQTFSPPAVAAAYFAVVPKPAALLASHADYSNKGFLNIKVMSGRATGVAAPSTNMTISEIFEEYLWTSAETELGAYAMTAAYLYANGVASFTVGYKIGGTFYGFAESIDSSYGYDLVTEYGELASDYVGDLSETTGTGYVDMANMVEWDTAGADNVNWDVVFD